MYTALKVLNTELYLLCNFHVLRVASGWKKLNGVVIKVEITYVSKGRNLIPNLQAYIM
jgi:hypothetical protein